MPKGYKQTQQAKEKRRITMLERYGKSTNFRKEGFKHSEETKEKMSKSALGKPKSEEHRKNLGLAKKGKIPSNIFTLNRTGKKNSKEHNRKISEGNKGKIVSKETRQKLSTANTGNKHTQETKDKISEANLGHIVTQETSKKISKRLTGRKLSKEHREHLCESHQGRIGPMLGRKFSDESKEKMSISRIRYMQNNPGKMRDTKPELAVKKILEDNNIKYQSQKHVGRKLYDFYLPDYNLLIEVDGCYWHSKGIKDEDLNGWKLENRKLDKIKNKIAFDKDFRLLRIWCDELDNLENLIKNNFLGLEYMEVRNCE